MEWISKAIYKQDVNVGNIEYKEGDNGKVLFLKHFTLCNNSFFFDLLDIFIPEYDAIHIHPSNISRDKEYGIINRGFIFDSLERRWTRKIL